MKKVLTVLLVLSLVLTAVFANGGKEKSTEAMELVIYNGGSDKEGQMMIDAFTAKYPNIKVSQVQDKSTNITTRVLQGEEADVVTLIAKENLDAMKEYLVSYKTANDKKYTADLKDHDYKYYATSMPLQVFMYNTDLLKGDMIPKSWFDLSHPKYKGLIVLGSPSTGSGYAQLYMMYKLSGDNLNLVKDIVANKAVYLPDSTSGPAGVERGEYAITITGEKNVGQAMAKGSPVMYLYPEEGTGRRIEGCGICANGKNLEAAKLFMDFITSKEGAEVILGMSRRSTHPDVGGPEGLPGLKDLKFFDYDDAEASKLKKTLQSEFNGLL
jgi:iron(III) transport system substrate-binding protein